MAHTSISPKRCPPYCALPPKGCCVTSEYGPDGAGMNFVRHQMAQLHHIDVADDDLLIEDLTGASVKEEGLAVFGQFSLFR